MTMMYSPVVRTNPVTGWKSLFGAAHQVEKGWINDVTERESEILKAYCKSSSNLRAGTVVTVADLILTCFAVLQLIAENHDLQVRFRWNQNDLAIWDK